MLLDGVVVQEHSLEEIDEDPVHCLVGFLELNQQVVLDFEIL